MTPLVKHLDCASLQLLYCGNLFWGKLQDMSTSNSILRYWWYLKPLRLSSAIEVWFVIYDGCTSIGKNVRTWACYLYKYHESSRQIRACVFQYQKLGCRCVSQMVLTRVNNVKSGWKPMFMVFTTAASDESQMKARLAFETIKKIVREHVDFITEAETHYTNCLIAITNNLHSLDVALNAIAFFRFCATRLAKGTIGEHRFKLRHSTSPNHPSGFSQLPHHSHFFAWC